MYIPVMEITVDGSALPHKVVVSVGERIELRLDIGNARELAKIMLEQADVAELEEMLHG